MFEATLRRADPEAPLRLVLAVVTVAVVGAVMAAGYGAGLVLRYLTYLLLYALWLMFGGQQPVFVAYVEPIEVLEVELDEAPMVEVDVGWDGVADLEPDDLLGGEAPAPPALEPEPGPTDGEALAKARILGESRMLLAVIGTTGDSSGGVLSVLSGSSGFDELAGIGVLSDGSLREEVTGGIGGLIGAKGTAIASGGLGSRGSGLGGGGTAEGLGGLGTRGVGRVVGRGTGQGAAGPVDRVVLVDAAGSGADIKARIFIGDTPVRCQVEVRPRQDDPLRVSGCDGHQARAREAVRQSGRADRRGTLTVLLVP